MRMLLSIGFSLPLFMLQDKQSIDFVFRGVYIIEISQTVYHKAEIYDFKQFTDLTGKYQHCRKKSQIIQI